MTTIIASAAIGALAVLIAGTLGAVWLFGGHRGEERR